MTGDLHFWHGGINLGSVISNIRRIHRVIAIQQNRQLIMMNRRQALQTMALGIAALGVTSRDRVRAESAETFELPPLPYPADALEPHIDARTMEIHHGRHHAAYVAGLNRAVQEAPGLRGRSIEDLLIGLQQVPDAVRTAVRNHGGGHHNHLLFWQMLSPKGGGEPRGELATAITRQFGGFEAFKAEFTRVAMGQFGSGWGWLTMTPDRQLRVEGTANQDSPLSRNRIPLLGVDVWEHAYYLRYQNRRGDYVAAFFNVINWDYVAERFHRGKP